MRQWNKPLHQKGQTLSDHWHLSKSQLFEAYFPVCR